jgi:hypothetical protein
MQPKRGEGGVGVSFVKLCFGGLGPGKIEAILSVQCFRDAIRCVSFSFGVEVTLCYNQLCGYGAYCSTR